jgi:hypothetical protein
MGKEVPVVVYALLQQPANLFPKRTVGEHILVYLKLWSIGATEWFIWVPVSAPHSSFRILSIKKIAFMKMGRNAKGSEGSIGSEASERTDGWT